MALVPCIHCHRHVKSADASCPFCGTALEATERPQIVAPPGLKRAALFALSASLTAGACSSDEPADMAQPVYGAPIEDDAAVDDDTSGDDEVAGAAGQPVYGAPVAGTSSTAGAGGSEGADDDLPQPVYGAPVDDDFMPDDASGNSDATKDAGASDAGADAGEPDKDDASAPQPQPLYGAIPAPVYGAPPTESEE